MEEKQIVKFKKEEFACKCRWKCGINRRSPKLDFMLDSARLEAGIPFVIRSGCRCPKHNLAVGGAIDSAHVTTEFERCEGVDITATTSRSRSKVLKGVILAGFHRIGIADTFIHVDVDERKDPVVTWLYPKKGEVKWSG